MKLSMSRATTTMVFDFQKFSALRGSFFPSSVDISFPELYSILTFKTNRDCYSGCAVHCK